MPQLHRALSLTIEALCNMSCTRYDDPAARTKLFTDTLDIVRGLIGPELRLTTMKVTCAWCQTPQESKEGNGSTGESHGICPSCMTKHLAGEPLQVLHSMLSKRELDIAIEDAAHSRTVADVDRMAADVARPGRTQFYSSTKEGARWI
jgi:hypothetical protein